MTNGPTLTALVVAAAVGATPGVVLAHTAAGPASGFAAGLAHPIGGADHLLAMVAVGLWASQLGGRARWVVPAAFVAVMLLAGVPGVAGVPLPLVEAGLVASVLVLGVLVTAAVRLPVTASAIVVGLLAVFHGHAHGAEMPLALDAVAYSAGFAVATALLHACGVAVGEVIARLGIERLARAAGTAIAVTGVYLALV
jgi:urease accessory protein